MNIIIINPDKGIWDLRDEYSKINAEFILGGIPKLEKNYNDYYTANETPSDIIPNETVLKETFIDQVAFPVYNINAEKYAKINKNRNILIQYDELWNTSSINKAKMLLKYNNVEDVKELRNEILKYEEMFIDINEKFALFYQYIESNGFLTYDASLVARNNIANKLANKVYDTEIKDIISVNTLRLNDMDIHLESRKINLNEIKNELSNTETDLAKQHLKVIEATKNVSDKRIQKETLKKQLNGYNDNLSKTQKDLDTVIIKVKNINNEKIDLDREKIELEAEISENEKEIEFYQDTINQNKEYHDKFVSIIIIDLCNNEYRETVDGPLTEQNITYLNSIISEILSLKTKIKDNNIITIIENLDVSITAFITENKDNISETDLESYDLLIHDIQDKCLTCLTIVEAIQNNTQDKLNKLSSHTSDLKNTLTKINGDLETTIKSYKVYVDQQEALENTISDIKDLISKTNKSIQKNEEELQKATDDLNKLSEENRNLTDKIIKIKNKRDDLQKTIDGLQISRDICNRMIESYKALYEISHELQLKANENFDQDQYDLQVMYEIQQLNEEFYEELRNADWRSE